MSSSTRTKFGPRAILALIAFSVFLGALDLTVVSTILRQVIFDFEIPFPSGLNDAAWIVTGYLLGYTLTMPLMGRLSDLYGRQRVYLLCLSLFVIGSMMVALSNSLQVIIAGRVVQALGAGALVPVSMAVIGDVFPRDKRAVALGILGAVDTAGWVVGPLYGALMVTQFQWRWIFFVNLPLGLVAGAFLWVALRDLNRPTAPVTMDYWGAAFLSLALASLSMGLNASPADTESNFAAATAQTGGGLSPNTPLFIAIFLLAALSFYVRERRAPSPLIDLAMFRNKTFSAACVVNLLVGGALIAAVVDVPLFVNTVLLAGRRYTPAQADLQSGMILAILTSSMVAAALLGGMLTEHWGYRRPALLGLLTAALGFALLSRWDLRVDNLIQARDLIVCGIGLGLVISPIATAVINTVSESQRGTASALVLILRLIGMTIVLSGLTTWGVQRFDELSRAVPLSATTVDFVVRISAQVMDEIFVLAAAVCVIAILPALFLRETVPFTRAVRSWW